MCGRKKGLVVAGIIDVVGNTVECVQAALLPCSPGHGNRIASVYHAARVGVKIAGIVAAIVDREYRDETNSGV